MYVHVCMYVCMYVHDLLCVFCYLNKETEYEIHVFHIYPNITMGEVAMPSSLLASVANDVKDLLMRGYRTQHQRLSVVHKQC